MIPGFVRLVAISQMSLAELRSSPIATGLIACLALGIGLLILWSGFCYWRQYVLQPSLADQLALAHNLTRAQRQTLARCLRALPAGERSRIFVDPACLLRVTPELAPHQAELRGIARKIYGPAILIAHDQWRATTES